VQHPHQVNGKAAIRKKVKHHMMGGEMDKAGEWILMGPNPSRTSSGH